MRNKGLHILLTLLEDERRALRQGDITAALALGPAKEKAMTALSALREEDLTQLHGAATRNAALLKAAMAGLAMAQGRGMALSQSIGNFAHYQEDGTSQTHHPQGGGLLERRR